MSNEHEEAFKGTREMAEAAAKKISQYLIKYGSQRDGKKNQIRYATSVVHGACLAVATSKGIHYDIYCDILEQCLAPCMEPSASPTYWSRYLEVVRYLHYQLVLKKQHKQAARIFHYMAAQPNRLQNEKDYVFVFSTCGQHLMAQRSEPAGEEREAGIEIILQALSALFTEMLQLNVNLNFCYAELMNDFLQFIFVKRSSGVYSYISQLPAKKSEMFDSFFKLLAQQKMPTPSSEKASVYMQTHLDAFTAFLHFDVVDKLQSQLALQHLRACTDQPSLQTDKAIHYMLSLLYYLVKVVYTRSIRKYTEICGKFQGFFEKSAEALLQKQWFLDSIVAITIFQTELHERGAQTPFDNFMVQMSTMDAITTHMQFIYSLIKLAPRVTQSKLMELQCCKSTRKHLALALANAAITSYTSFLTNCKNLDELEEDVTKTTELQQQLMRIVIYGVNVLNTMQCINEESTALRIFIQRFLFLTVAAKTPAQAKLCNKIAEQFICLKGKISRSDWIAILRRIYKTTKLLDNQDISLELQCCYVTTLTTEEPRPDHALLHNQIAIYYNHNNVITATTTQPMRDKCLLELYEGSSSGFKPQLEQRHKRLLYMLECQHVNKYYKMHLPLIQSLMRMSPSDYDLVLLARLYKQQAAVVEQIKRFGKPCKPHDLKRLDKLIRGHVMTVMLSPATDAQKQFNNVDTKDCQESALEELLLRKEFATLNIRNELVIVDIALDAFHSFKAFYDESDASPISSDEALIDWEAYVDDVLTIATYLQLAGYLEYATTVWLFLYEISTKLQDHYNMFRAVAFFCEHCSAITQLKEDFDLSTVVAQASTIILHSLSQLSSLTKRSQNTVLQCLCQMAFYHSQQHNYCYAQMMLDCVKLQHEKLNDRQGKFDIVQFTLAAVKFRIQWLHSGSVNEKAEENATEQEQPEQLPLWRKCLLREVETLLDKISDIVFIAPGDSTNYMVVLITVLQQISECAANRLCDNFMGSHMVAVFRVTLQSGLTLRLVQLLAMWMWTNLQMENIEKAQTKLNLIENLLGIERLRDPHQVKQAGALIPATTKPNFYEVPSNELLAAIQPIRKLVQVHLSPIRPNKLQLSPSARTVDLKRYLSIDSTQFPNGTLEWTYFHVGCLNARLYYLVDDFDQLDVFYEQAAKWIQERKLVQPQSLQVLNRIYENVQLLSIQHYVNYLRAHGKSEKALEHIEQVLMQYDRYNKALDNAYWNNFVLQKEATHSALLGTNEQNRRQSLIKSRRVLVFHISPEEKPVEIAEKVPGAKRSPRRLVICVRKKQEPVKISKESSESSSSSSNSSDPEISITNATNSTSDDLNVCQVIDTVDLDSTVEQCDIDRPITRTVDQIKAKAKPVPKTIRKRRAVKGKPQEDLCEAIVLDEGNEKLPAKGAAIGEDDKLAAEMENLQLDSNAENTAKNKKSSARTRSRPLVKSNSNTDIIVLEDSPVQQKGKLIRSASTRLAAAAPAPLGNTNTQQTRKTRNRNATDVRRAISANIENIDTLRTDEQVMRRDAGAAGSTRRRMKS